MYRDWKTVISGLQRVFKDEGNNLHRWLVDQPTVVRHPVTGDFTELIIEEEFEPLHNLLEFCKLQNSGMTYDIEYFETLTMIVKASENIQQNVF